MAARLDAGRGRTGRGAAGAPAAARRPPRRRAPAAAAAAERPAPPPAPYNLRARCWYQLHLCRAEAAAARSPDSLVRLSLFGWTLGGIFVAAWDDSPLGPYKECALMAGLALAPRSLTLGAWPRPLLVTSAGAVAAGRDVFGHADTVLADIDLARNGDDDIVFTLEGEARPSVRVPEVLLPSEGTASDDVPDASAASTLSLPLPSLSGSAGNLCVYDLLVPLVSGVARLAPTARVRVEGAAAEGSDAAALLDGPAMLAVSLGPCVVVASEPRPAQARARTSGGHSRRAAVLAPLASLAGALGAHAAVAGEGDDARAVLARDMRASPVRPALTVRAYVAALEAALPAYDNILRNGMAAVAEGDAPYSDLARLADSLVIAPCDDVVQAAFYLPWAALEEFGEEKGARLQELSLVFSRRTRELDATTRAGASLDAEPEDALNALDAAEASLQQLLDEAKLLLAGGQ